MIAKTGIRKRIAKMNMKQTIGKTTGIKKNITKKAVATIPNVSIKLFMDKYYPFCLRMSSVILPLQHTNDLRLGRLALLRLSSSTRHP